MHRLLPVLLGLVLVLAAAACGDASDDTPDADERDGDIVLIFSAESDNLDVFSGEPPFEEQRLVTNADDDPDGRDVNGQVCFFDDGKRFVAGEDTDQPDPPAGWGTFQLEGDELGGLSATQIGRLTPTYQDHEGDIPENYGCGVLSDGRVLTTDIGDQASGDGNGQLILWFPPLDVGVDGEVGTVAFCKLDVAIPTALGIAVDDEDNVYVASARTAPNEPESGVWRYSGPFPTDDTPEGGCGATDATGAPAADEVSKELFIPGGDHGLATPSSVAITDGGDFFVASVFTGVINHYDARGAFVETILEPAEGEEIGETSYSTGTPQGIGLGPDGTLYYADIGIVWPEDRALPGPGPNSGTVRRITFVDGEPQAPKIIAEGRSFPDGIGVLALRR